MVVVDRFGDHGRNFYSREGDLLPVNRYGYVNKDYDLPGEIENLILAAERLSCGFDFVRVDLYCHRGDVYFGEMTRTPAAARERFVPDSWDTVFGSYWDYSMKDKSYQP